MKSVRAIRGLALTSLASLGLIAMTPAFAESEFTTGNGAIDASARVDFSVIIPKFISFQVGQAGAGNIDLVEFDVAVADVGTGTDIARTNGGALAVTLRGNGGNINVTADTTGTGLTDGTSGDTIAFSEILSDSDNAALDAPTLVDGVSAAVVVTPNVGTRVVNRTANWSYEYSNTDAVGFGTYDGQVLYTAAMP